MYAEQISQKMIQADLLIDRAKQGDEQSFNQLVNLWYKRIYNYVLKHCGDEELTSDITQKTFIAVFRSLPKLKETSSFKPWLYKIATNFCYEESRKKSKSKSISFTAARGNQDENMELEQGEAKGVLFNPERSFQQVELEKILFDCLGELSEEYRTVIIMKEYEGMKFHEIAEALNASENTVKTRLYRGLKSLKGKLDERNITKETIHYEL